MLFNTFEFILFFLPIVLIGYFSLTKIRLPKASDAFIAFASLFFYSYWNLSFLPLILSSILFNYILGLQLNKQDSKNIKFNKTLLIIGILINLSALCYYKYISFILLELNNLLDTNFTLHKVILPLAISFYTFQQISYLVDSYKGEAKEYDFLRYVVFVTFFPQLIAGPIVHHTEMIPQFLTLRNKFIQYKNILNGLLIFSIGLFKKVVIADTFSTWATTGFKSFFIPNFTYQITKTYNNFAFFILP